MFQMTNETINKHEIKAESLGTGRNEGKSNSEVWALRDRLLSHIVQGQFLMKTQKKYFISIDTLECEPCQF